VSCLDTTQLRCRVTARLRLLRSISDMREVISIRDRMGDANSRIGVLHVCSNRGGGLMMSGWSRHPQCYNQKASVLDCQYRRTEPVGFRGILCAPENLSQNINTAKLRTGSQGGGSVMRSSSGWIVAECRAGLWVALGVVVWCLSGSQFFLKF